MLNRNSVFCRIAVITAVVFGLVQMPLAPAQAELIGTDSVVAQTQVQDAHATVQSFMARDDVRAEFLRHGVNPAEADQRIGSLSDSEVLQLAQTIETAPAGGLIGLIIGAGSNAKVTLSRSKWEHGESKHHPSTVATFGSRMRTTSLSRPRNASPNA